MPTLITQDDGTVLWDYDVPAEPKKSTKKAAPVPVDEKEPQA